MIYSVDSRSFFFSLDKFQFENKVKNKTTNKQTKKNSITTTQQVNKHMSQEINEIT